ncbi:MAG: hypothetical protein WDO13_15790 [Verrucomicrobiota bacterium]
MFAASIHHQCAVPPANGGLITVEDPALELGADALARGGPELVAEPVIGGGNGPPSRGHGKVDAVHAIGQIGRERVGGRDPAFLAEDRVEFMLDQRQVVALVLDALGDDEGVETRRTFANGPRKLSAWCVRTIS